VNNFCIDEFKSIHKREINFIKLRTLKLFCPFIYFVKILKICYKGFYNSFVTFGVLPSCAFSI
jgi:hypothetical protein